MGQDATSGQDEPTPQYEVVEELYEWLTLKLDLDEIEDYANSDVELHKLTVAELDSNEQRLAYNLGVLDGLTLVNQKLIELMKKYGQRGAR